MSQKKRFRAEILATAEGTHLGSREQKKKDTVVVLLWSADKKEAEIEVCKIAKVLSHETPIGEITYVVQSIKLHRGVNV